MLMNIDLASVKPFQKPKDFGLRVTESMRSTVVYFGRVRMANGQETVRYAGSGFVVSVPSSSVPGIAYHYIVTARHVADELLRGDYVMRMNRRDGQPSSFRGSKDDKWWFHPTEPSTVDVAVSTAGIIQSNEFIPVSERMFLTDETIAQSYVGPGDEIYMIGLFSYAPGETKNQPIVRTGNLSLIPNSGELVPGLSLRGRSVSAEVYLVEARSIGGMSGSPAFVRMSVMLDVPVGDIGKQISVPTRQMRCQLTGQSFLLGLVHGHWSILPEDRNKPDPPPARKSKKDRVNIGIAVVVPAKKIREVLNHPELVEMRRVSDAATIAEQATTEPDHL